MTTLEDIDAMENGMEWAEATYNICGLVFIGFLVWIAFK